MIRTSSKKGAELRLLWPRVAPGIRRGISALFLALLMATALPSRATAMSKGPVVESEITVTVEGLFRDVFLIDSRGRTCASVRDSIVGVEQGCEVVSHRRGGDPPVVSDRLQFRLVSPRAGRHRLVVVARRSGDMTVETASRWLRDGRPGAKHDDGSLGMAPGDTLVCTLDVFRESRAAGLEMKVRELRRLRAAAAASR